MGFYRLLLAVLVLTSHAGIIFWRVNEGVVAVISFLMLSGFVMTALVKKHYASIDKFGFFLIDRTARLAPQFLLYLVLTISIIAFGHNTRLSLMVVDIKGIVLHLLLIPLDFFMYWDPKRLYLPQAWSLGLEATFYVVFPFILLSNTRLMTTIVSLFIYATAVTGWIATETFGYRLLPGTFFIFMLGSFIYDEKSSRLSQWLTFAWGVSLLLFLATVFLPKLDRPYSKEVALGLVLGLPIMWVLRNQPSNGFDTLAGNLSYGVFLNHVALIYLAQTFGAQTTDPACVAVLAIASLMLSSMSYLLVEEPILRYRRAMRERQRFQHPPGGLFQKSR